MPDRSHLESRWVPATIETGRIINVNIEDWSVDIVAEYANKRYFDLQVMMSYFHYVNGEGFYCMPEVGAMVWLCRPTQGKFAAPFVMGFQAPFDTDNGNFRCGRQALNPGDMMMRTRDENFVILRRGGVVQIGATPIAQRMYIPIRNFIKDFCENYELHTFGGELTWITDRTDVTTDGSAPTKFSLVAKEKANDPAQIATLTIGSHGESDPTTLELVIYESGAQGALPKVRMVLEKTGSVSWYADQDLALTAKNNITIEAQEGDVSVKATKGNVNYTANKNMNLQAEAGNMKLEASGTVLEKSTGHTIDAPEIKLGGAAAIEPVPLGLKLKDFLTAFVAGVAAAKTTKPGDPIAFSAASTLSTQLETILSPVSKTM
jgi:hypothetical protein